MKAYVDRDTCIGCEMCAGTCDEVFSMDDEGKSVPINEEISDNVLESAKEAASGCPVGAITIE